MQQKRNELPARHELTYFINPAELEALLQDWRAHLENNESAYVERIREAEERDAQAALRANRESARATGFGNLGSLFDAALGGAQ